MESYITVDSRATLTPLNGTLGDLRLGELLRVGGYEVIIATNNDATLIALLRQHAEQQTQG